MLKRRCPYCKEKIKREAKVCRFCGQTIEPLKNSSTPWWGWVSIAFSGLLVGAGAFFLYQVFKERKLWSSQDSLALPTKNSSEIDEELMDF